MAIEPIEARERGWRRSSRQRDARRDEHPDVRHADLSFDELHRLYYADLVAYVRRRVRDRDFAEDITQESFLRAYRARHQLDPTRPAWPWLLTITRNVMLNAIRDERRARRFVSTVDDVAAAADADAHHQAPGPELRIIGRDETAVLADSLATMSPIQRRLLVMRTVEELSYAEIAARERMSLDSLKSHLKRARKHLRAAVDRAEIPALVVWARSVRLRVSAAGRQMYVALTPLEGVMHLTCLALTALTIAAAGYVPAARSRDVPLAGLVRSARTTAPVEAGGIASTMKRGDPPTLAVAQRHTDASVIAIHGTIDRSKPDRRTVVLTVSPSTPVTGPSDNAVTIEVPCDYHGATARACTLIDQGR